MQAPFLISQSLIILSWDPEIIWGSSSCITMHSTMSRWPEKQAISALVRMSQSRTVESLPPVAITFNDGWRARAKTPLKCPWYYLTTLFCSKSQHFTYLSSPAEKRYGCLSETASLLTVLIWPVKVTLSCPVARSQNLMVLSLLPETKKRFNGSIARHRTQPLWPAITVFSFQGACHFGSIILLCLRTI